MGALDFMTGHSDFHATAANPSWKHFQDQNAGTNKDSLAAALAARNGAMTPMDSAAHARGTPYDTAQQAQFRGQQASLAQALGAQANGQGPSLAQMQMQHGMDQAIAAQHAQAASARGLSPGMAQRMAANNIAGLQGQMANDAGMMRMQEQMAARQQLAGVLGSARQQDMGMASDQAQLGQQLNLANAGFQQQSGLANQQAALQAQQQKDAMSQFYTGSQLGIDANQAAANQAYENLRVGSHNSTNATNAGIDQNNSQGQQKLTGAVIGAVGSALASDRNLKTDIRKGDSTADGFLDAIKAHMFRYKGDETPHLGVMAQDVEKAPGGKGMVRDTPIGKVIDVPQAVGRLLASSATLNDRLKELEKRKR